MPQFDPEPNMSRIELETSQLEPESNIELSILESHKEAFLSDFPKIQKQKQNSQNSYQKMFYVNILWT